MDEAIKKRLIKPAGKTPHASMEAALYSRLDKDPKLIKLDAPGSSGRAKRGSVRWTLRDTNAVE